MASFMPRAKDVITEEDIQAWVSAGVRAATPLMNSETREILLFAMREHQRILEEQTRVLAMRRTLEVQSGAMQHTIETQGRQVTRLIAFGGLTAIFSKFWQDIPPWLRDKRWSIAAAYGLGVLAIIFGEVAIWHMGKKRLAGNDPGALTFLGRFLLSATAGVLEKPTDSQTGGREGRTEGQTDRPTSPLEWLAFSGMWELQRCHVTDGLRGKDLAQGKEEGMTRR
ncbi:unnamed protein product [Symbiodinium necroappetens]|uniref:Uncharacterized protein n=1 Tax=Symbiodinium necroappetens TaxID=1628268 RepID=A0A812P1K4_9DINO|nr:unnamed protein product [Symbiodinium necroappetens]